MKRILVQLDTDVLPSVFDRVVAVDAGVDELMSYGGITPENVTSLVHGAIFTRGGSDLKNTALFVGGSDVAAGERVLEQVTKSFFGPMRVSVMMDSNGSNTTAAAAVLYARRHLPLAGCQALVLAGTGPVGQRAAQLLAHEGARVRVASRSFERAAKVCEAISQTSPTGSATPIVVCSECETETACDNVELVIAAGAAGVQLLPASISKAVRSIKVLIDLNAYPPLGIETVDAFDKAKERNGVICYGALGVGGLKMRIHKAGVQRLFEENTHVLDTMELFRLGESQMK